MASGTVLWAGKQLSAEEEESTRALIDLLHRTGAHESAEAFARFLPERSDEWTPDELEARRPHGALAEDGGRAPRRVGGGARGVQLAERRSAQA